MKYDRITQRLIRFLAIGLTSMLIVLLYKTTSVQAFTNEDCICYIEGEDPCEIKYGTPVKGKGWSYDGDLTLTFDNFRRERPESKTENEYVSMNISFYAKNDTFNLVLKGDNYWGGDLWVDYGTLNITGDGTLTVEDYVLINRTSKYDFGNGDVMVLDKNEVFTGILKTDHTITDKDGKIVKIDELKLLDDGMQHYDIYGAVFTPNDDSTKKAPEKVSKIKLSSTKAGQLKIKITQLKKADGYEITYSTSSKFSKSKTKIVKAKAGKTTVSKTISKLTSEKTYYVKVRAYNTDAKGNKLYGNYSSVKKIVLK